MSASFRSRVRLTLGALALTAGAIVLAGPLQVAAGELGPFTCTDRSGGVADIAATVTAIRIAHHDGYDRLVIGFASSNSMPQYQLTQQATSDLVRDASGLPLTLGGSAGLRVVLRNADITPGAPTHLKPELRAIREVAQIGNFERVVSYGVGLAKPACFRVLELSGPTRLVIDVETPADAPAAMTAVNSGEPAGDRVRSRGNRPSGATGAAGTPGDLPVCGADPGIARSHRGVDHRRHTAIREEVAVFRPFHPCLALAASIRLACSWNPRSGASSRGGGQAIATPSRRWWIATASSCCARPG